MEKIKSILIGMKRTPHKTRQKTRGQSFVEFALLLPILILLLLVMVEYGFMLNTYLSLADSTRQAARAFSNDQPITKETAPDGTETKIDDLTFYPKVAEMLITTLDSNSYQIQYDTSADSKDNILVSVITADVDTSTDPVTFTFTRHPDGKQYFSLNGTSGTLSKYTNNKIQSYMEASGTPVDAGLLIVEVYYTYEGTLKIPNWFNMVIFPTDDNPIVLYASTIMPLAAVMPPRPTITKAP